MILLALVCLLSVPLGLLSAVPLPYNPCPRVFQYERILPSTDDVILFPSNNNLFWKGVVTVPKFVLSGESIRLKLVFAVPTTIPSKYVGRVDIRGDKEKIFGTDASTLLYDVMFPGQLPVPSLLQVRLNGRFLCNAPRPQAAVVTKIILEHSLYPFRINATGRFGGQVRLDEGLLEKDTGNSCGKFTIPNPLVVGGDVVSQGIFPWLVPIFKKTARGLMFHCSGSLVSESHIISAAHCFISSKATDLVAFVGRHNIHDWTESETQTRKIAYLHVHPDFDRSTLFSDIAVLVLDSPVEWTDRYTPVCLWHGADALEPIVGRQATVVGWGVNKMDGGELSTYPRSVKIPIVAQETCLRSQKEFLYFSSNRTLCAGTLNGTGPCNGDSGGGLYLPMETAKNTIRWYLRGIVSLTLQHPTTKQCDLYNYAVFTDVAKFQSWLKNVTAS